jgi:DNA-binding CsgD family transcriptional regulator
MGNGTVGNADASNQNRKRGRPRCRVSVAEVLELRGQGMSLRQIGLALGIGKSTVKRLCRPALPPMPCQNSLGPCQNSRVDGAGQIPQVRPLIRLLRPKRNPEEEGQFTSSDGPPGRCPHCGSNVWRKMPCGPVCCACHPVD